MQQFKRVGVTSLVLMLTLGWSCEALPYFPSAQSKGPDTQDHHAALIADGIASMEHGDTSSARALFLRVLAIDPHNLTARTYLGILADHAGQLGEAERQFAAAVSIAPDSPEAHNNYGAILLKLGQKRRATAQFQASLRLNGKQAGALVNLAQLRFESATPEGLRQARDLFRRAYALAPEPETARSLVVISLRLHEAPQAASDYAAYAAHLDGASERVTVRTARSELGAALLEGGLASEAAQELEASVRSDPSNINDIVLLSRAYQAKHDLRAAGRVLESAMARGMDAAPLYAALVEIYEASGHVENAIPAMRRAIEIDPKNESYRFRYAMLLIDTNAPQAAVIRLREALEEFPKSAKLWCAMGLAQFQDNKSDDAARAFGHCVQLDPHIFPAYAYLGIIDVDQGKIPEAVAQYRKALAAQETSAVSHFLMSEALEKLVPPDEQGIESHLKRALEIDPAFQQAHLAYGKFLLKANKPSEAVTELENVVKADPNLAEAYYQLGRAYMRLKRKDEAQATMMKFEKLSNEEKEKSEKDRREILRRLADVRF
ncbi:MAG TPA: tetratricopeptide repeat protein [Candidatus Dormibacteraeota bacterium]|nr:tetratricopeptide repeat protein [Candidatus Dormibacteraeota bacterium]